MAKDAKPTDDKVDKTETQADKPDKNQDADPQNTDTMIPKPRFDEINERMKKAEAALEKRKKADAEAKEKALKEEKKFEELLAIKEKELEQERARNILAEKREAVLASLSVGELKAKNPSTVMRLIDFDKITKTDDGIDGIDDEVKRLQASDPYLFGGEPDTADTDEKKPGRFTGGYKNAQEAQEKLSRPEFVEWMKKNQGVDLPA